MNNKNTNLMRTPLRNSYLANKPFCSPIRNNTTPVKSNLKRLYPVSPSPDLKVSTPPQDIIKRRKIELDKSENICGLTFNLQEPISEPTKSDLLAIKNRIRSKKLEIEVLKTKLAYRKKNKKEDVHVDIVRWREACQQALTQYQKDCSEKLDNGKTLEMTEILKMLGIPEHIVDFPKDH
ncbi:uncharacterized protein LOC103573828 [Microplitis demolitor]|uniref:uncharacterized protein LOC103573828 n=1 Tax=Microplitis demolitor TaxID=69319 RepID=UPI0004CD7135|nr:uncharacterized protein LOC103573828 [Microplitis demolitor]